MHRRAVLAQPSAPGEHLLDLVGDEIQVDLGHGLKRATPFEGGHLHFRLSRSISRVNFAIRIRRLAKRLARSLTKRPPSQG
jgi:hypothetical protein